MPPMTSQEFKKCREKCGFSKPLMAAHLRIPNAESNGRNAINRLERGNHSNGIPGPTAVAAEALASGFRATCGTCERQASDLTVRACTHTNCPFPREDDEQVAA